MKRALLIVGSIIILAVVYWLAAPLFIEKRVDEKLADIMPQEAEPRIITQGNFVGLAGHNAEGAAKLLKIGEKYYVRFEDDFRVTNGPDLFVYFGKDDQCVAEAQIDSLKGNI